MTVTQLFPQPEAQPNQFETLWKMWPNKAKKPLARAKYEAILQGLKTRTLDKDSGTYVDIELEATEDQIIGGAKAFISSQIDKNTYKLKDGGKYIPHLGTWLNQGRFQDHEG